MTKQSNIKSAFVDASPSNTATNAPGSAQVPEDLSLFIETEGPAFSESMPPVEWAVSATGSSPNSSLGSSPYDSFAFPEIISISRDQVDFCIQRLQSSITSLVLNNGTPFIHPSSYADTLPPTYQDLISISAQHTQATPRNQQRISQMLDHKLSALLHASRRGFPSVEAGLLAVQSLLTYQIMRLFSPDIWQRAAAERHLKLLASWTSRLQHSVFEAEQRAAELSATKSPYQSWIFLESVRRTILMSYMLQALYGARKDGVCSLIPLLSVLPVSSHGQLWRASETEWYSTVMGGDMLLTSYGDYVAAWKAGTAFDVDIYETILLVACKGPAGIGLLVA